MIRLMIVDDEEEIRQGIKNTIEWEANGVQICDTAENGKEAVEKIDRLQPEIILLDIRMPVMSGLQVLEHIKACHYSTKSIILSGYDDFAYAQSALKNGASDFLLKPCLPQEILETVLKVKALVEEEKGKKELLDGLKTRFHESLPFLKQMYLTKLLKKIQRQKVDFIENSALYKINLENRDISAALIRIDEFSAFAAQNSYEDAELYKFAIWNIADEILGAKLKCEIFQLYDDIVALINGRDRCELSGLLNEVKDNILKHLGLSISIGLGSACESIDTVYLSYDEAVKAIDFAFFAGPNSITEYEDIKELISYESAYPIHEETELLNSIKSGKSSELEENIEAFFKGLSRANYSKDVLLKSGMALLMSIYHLGIEKSIDPEEVFGNMQTTISDFLKLNSLASVKAKLYQLAYTSCEKLNNKKSSNKVVEKALQFISNNYNKDISLETVANEVFITPSYLSLLFKQTMAENFIDYLHKVRIEKACELLKNLRYKTYEVASMVGYNDVKYFSQLFKKYTSMTPSEYKSSL
jgi:two-component system response regulator YesN